MEHGLKYRGICLTECVAVAAMFAITTAIIIPAAGSLNRGSMESDALGRIRRLSQAHPFYAADFDDRVITYTADDLTSLGQSMMQAVFSWSQWNESQENPIYPNPDWPESTFHPGLRLGWGGSLYDQDRMTSSTTTTTSTPGILPMQASLIPYALCHKTG